MARYFAMISVCFSLAFIFSVVMLPAYAEITSLKDDKSLYVPGDKIHFTGAVGITDYQKLVNLVIHDPSGKFVLISGNYSDSTYTFEITVDTNNTNQFSTKGTYEAIAFVGTESEGKIISFDVSPDGSPVTHLPPENSNTQDSSPVQALPPQNFNLQINDGVGISDSAGSLSVYQSGISKVKPSDQINFNNIVYPVILICIVGIGIAIFFTRKRNKTKKHFDAEKKQALSSNVADEIDDDYAFMILKNRLAKGDITIEEFKAIKDVLVEP